MPDTLTPSLQAQVLSLLIFSEEHFKIVRNSIDLDNWTGDHAIRQLVERLYQYIDFYNEPAKDHVYLIADDLDIRDAKDSLIQLLQSCEIDYFQNIEVRSNGSEFILAQLEKFQRKSIYQKALFEAVEAWDKEDLEKVDSILIRATQQRQQLFDPGLRLSDILKLLYKTEEERSDDCITLNIPPLDCRGLIPRRKELVLFVAPPKKGKTWWLVHCGKMGILQNRKVCHISLEMNDEQVGTRYYQSLFGSTVRHLPDIRMMRMSNNRFDVTSAEDKPRSLKDEEVLEKIRRRLEQDLYLDKNLWIKKFPARSLTVNGLKAYIQSLKTHHKFHPDMIILDYVDLMNIDTNNYRLNLKTVYEELHGMAAELDVMLVSASQVNREGAQSKEVSEWHVGEDWSKIGIADLVITYSQTKAEKALGIARLRVTNARNEQDNLEILITQCYTLGQFCLDAQENVEFWQKALKDLLKDEEPEEESSYAKKRQRAAAR